MKPENGLKYNFKASLAISVVTDINVEIFGGVRLFLLLSIKI